MLENQMSRVSVHGSEGGKQQNKEWFKSVLKIIRINGLTGCYSDNRNQVCFNVGWIQDYNRIVRGLSMNETQSIYKLWKFRTDSKIKIINFSQTWQRKMAKKNAMVEVIGIKSKWYQLAGSDEWMMNNEWYYEWLVGWISNRNVGLV